MTDLLTIAEPAEPIKPTTPAVMVALRERFCPPEFALFEEVGDSGSSSGTYADAVAVNMWASRGYAITGFEVKVSRSDWLRELKSPEKAEAVITRCDRWYLVAPDDVYKIDEVPISWGILSFKNGKLRETRKPPQLDAKPITRAFVAQMFRRSHSREERDISARIAKALADDRAAIDRRIEDEVKARTRMLREQADKWEHLVKELGENKWASADTIVAAVRVVLKAGVSETYGGIGNLLRQMKNATNQLEEASKMFTDGPTA
jgi:hypothetical protein